MKQFFNIHKYSQSEIDGQLEKERFHQLQQGRYRQLQKEAEDEATRNQGNEYFGFICDGMGADTFYPRIDSRNRFDIRKLYMDV